MTTAQALQTLIAHTEWLRRDPRRWPVGHMTRVGQAIDLILARMPALEEIADIAGGLTIERDEARRLICGVSGDYKDGIMLADAMAKLKETDEPGDGREGET
jgi:hypothetical protein